MVVVAVVVVVLLAKSKKIDEVGWFYLVGVLACVVDNTWARVTLYRLRKLYLHIQTNPPLFLALFFVLLVGPLLS